MNVERLGWTLVHFVWQGFTIAFLYAIVRRAMGARATPNARYLLACAALGAMLAAPFGTWTLLRSADAPAVTPYHVRNLPPPAGSASTAAPSLSSAARESVAGVRPEPLLSWVVWLWLAGSMVFWVRLAGGWMLAARLRSTLVRPAPPEWQVTVSALARRIGVSRPVRLLNSALVQVPAVTGWLRPVILVPVGALAGLPAEQVQAVLLHELAHIRRYDYPINLLQSVAEALLFYHPAVWWVSGHMRSERELCCDDVAVSASGDALMYAHALAQLEAYRPAHFNAALAANGGSLANRIARLLGHSRADVPGGPGPGVFAVALLLTWAVYGLFGQSAQHPAFQTVSLKPNPSHWSDPVQHAMGVHGEPGGALTAQNAPLTLLIQRAYGVQAFQVIGGPAWINSPGYDLNAKPEHPADRKQMWLMLQTLLADRFRLALHQETRVLPVYDLTVAAGGAKLPEAQPVHCAALQPDAPTPPKLGPGEVDCGYVAGPMLSRSSGLQLEGSQVRTPGFIDRLALILGRPVMDKTGFTKAFDLNLSFTADSATQGLPGFGGPGDPGGTRLPTDPHLPNIFAALEGQLGLKLTPAQAPVEVLVIDHVEKPSED